MKKKDDMNKQIDSLISNNVEIKGEIKTEGSMRIDGNVEGKVQVKGDLIIGKQGLLKGEIEVDNLVLAGRMEGILNAKEKVEISSTGQMIGDIVCKILAIEEEGILEGNSKMHNIKTNIEEKSKKQKGNK